MTLSKSAIATIAALSFTAVVTKANAEVQQKPNVVLIVTDDMGYSDLSCYGGEIPTPNICSLAENGVKVTDYYTNPMSAPTRSMLLTGVDNHKAGLGNMPPLMGGNQVGRPGYEGSLNNRVVTVAEMLKTAGYHTYMAGKWHLGHTYQSSPKGRGFDKSFAYSGGGVSHWADALPLNPFEAPFFYYLEDGLRVDKLPADFYSSDYYTDKIISYLDSQPADEPFFAYLAFTAPHDPLHAHQQWIDKFDDGRYAVGYDVIRQQRLANAKALGLVSEDTQDVVNNKDYKPWNTLSAEEKKVSAKKMAIYAAMVAEVDANVGKLIDHLKETGEFDNTLFIYTHDNGTNPKPTSNYTGNSEKFLAQFDNSFDNMGQPGSYLSYEAGWAEAGTSPFAYYKTTTGQGGVRVPLIVSGNPIARKNSFASSGKIHVTDVTPTIIDWAGVEKPTHRNGVDLYDFDGHSFRAFIEGKSDHTRTPNDAIFFELNNYKMVIQGDYKLRAFAGAHAKTVGTQWMLFNIVEDPSEQHDLASTYPDKVEKLAALYDNYAKNAGVIEKEPGYPTMYHRQTWSIRDGVFSGNPDAPHQTPHK
ncbi:arylsulfatase [Alteromonas sp. 14N.309.X.WAT.G.H12]|uniref:arylsulfatase n=1 Tax=Alteromonas sp. 14N.309.X.WAT.G.H12 TaxID=3120824 RepID=UPI002FD0FB80